jgi:hypothetical protein
MAVFFKSEPVNAPPAPAAPGLVEFSGVDAPLSAYSLGDTLSSSFEHYPGDLLAITYHTTEIWHGHYTTSH